MASGFIILRDGRCLSVRHAVHDAVVRAVANAIDSSTPLRGWLHTQVPIDTDVDLGYAFVRGTNGEHVRRQLDLRGLTTPNRISFESAVRKAEPMSGARAPVEDVHWALNRLRQMLDACDEGRPVLELSDWRAEAPPYEARIGPGWEDSA